MNSTRTTASSNTQQVLREAHRVALGYIQDRIGKRTEREERAALPENLQNRIFAHMAPRVDSVLSFVHYSNQADLQRLAGKSADAIGIYGLICEGVGRGALDGYVNRPRELRQIAQGGLDVVSGITPIYLDFEQTTSDEGIRWTWRMPISAVFQPHHAFGGRAETELTIGQTAQAAADYYVASAISKRCARNYEGVADSLIDNLDPRNTRIEELVKKNPELDGRIVLAAACNYDMAAGLLDRMIQDRRLEAQLDALRSRNSYAPDIERIEDLLAQRERARTKSSELVQLL